jgi:hypothetical protein
MPAAPKDGGQPGDAPMVLYCLIRRKLPRERQVRFLMLKKPQGLSFPPTKFRPGEDLYTALQRVMEGDLGLPLGTYFPEQELEMIPSQVGSPAYAGLPEQWYLYPADLSLSEEGLASLERTAAPLAWWTLREILARVQEPNVRAIAAYLQEKHSLLLRETYLRPSMAALAAHWAAENAGGVRVAREQDIRRILSAGDRAFNLRVADPYLPYHKQGLGFTWSFFTPKDKQDLHVHGLPAVEIYGVMEGRLMVWHKPLNLRGARTWRWVVLEPGDWLEVEPLQCHFAGWLTPEGLGTVIKAAATGELAGVGRLGARGKTTCPDCSSRGHCALHPRLAALMEQYARPYAERDYGLIVALTRKAEYM